MARERSWHDPNDFKYAETCGPARVGLFHHHGPSQLTALSRPTFRVVFCPLVASDAERGVLRPLSIVVHLPVSPDQLCFVSVMLVVRCTHLEGHDVPAMLRVLPAHQNEMMLFISGNALALQSALSDTDVALRVSFHGVCFPVLLLLSCLCLH